MEKTPGTLARFDVIFALLEEKPRTLREIVFETGWDYFYTNTLLRETRKLGSVEPPVKKRPGRFHGGPVVYRIVRDGWRDLHGD